MATKSSYDDATSTTDRIRSRWDRFTAWRLRRPFLGGLLLCLAGIIITWVPMQILPDLLFVGGELTGFLAIGVAFGVLVFLTGVFALYKPAHSDVIGVVGIALSILSLVGSLGGLVFGLLFGILGGNLCLAWKPDEDRVPDRVTEPSPVDNAVAGVRNRLQRVVGPVRRRLRHRLETATTETGPQNAETTDE
ncbi:DUF6114 domain-containing protein [Natrialba asiatica]|uniref:Uncharacterized protein n=1 Tax=Natrialba asiatica (strain ATCC 700177 / DSM 12278 / JCM 9576 / FERM P-10747 / NBRC 102637 / 172P1) TaxID=29540 RepID=M0AWY7_NATA1|nr:DUF6114 domain-containing protein [Natrialba asiatica]ELZ02842.1 hypothetical protein C481_06547 [Natrialba asiatica DSM 12278]